MRGYPDEEYTKGKCISCGKYSDKRILKKCPDCRWLVMLPTWRRLFTPFIEQERYRNMSQEEKDVFDKKEIEK